jgi:hypothetical protein
LQGEDSQEYAGCLVECAVDETGALQKMQRQLKNTNSKLLMKIRDFKHLWWQGFEGEFHQGRAMELKES